MKMDALLLVAKAAGTLLGIYALVILLIFVFQDSLQYLPDEKAYTQEQVGVRSFEEFPVTTKDGLPIKGWYAQGDADKPVIVVFHGNASTYQWRAPDFEKINAYGYGVLLVGYRGYGGNPGKPSEAAFYDDAEVYLKRLKEVAKIADDRVVLYGESLGTGVAVEMGVRHPKFRAMILENPFTNMVDLAKYHYPFIPFAEHLVRNKYDNIAKIGTIKRPKLFLIGEADTIIPPKFGYRLFDAAVPSKKLKTYVDVGHVDVRLRGGLGDIRAYLSIFNN